MKPLRIDEHSLIHISIQKKDEIMHFATTLMELKKIMLGKINQ